MKNFKAIAAMLLMSISSPVMFTSCQDDNIDQNQVNNQVLSLLNNSTDLQSLDNISYEVPFEVKAKGDWRIDFDFDDCTAFCYAYPKQGKGDTQIKICVLDNATDEKHTGEMIITDFGDNAKQTVVKIGQKDPGRRTPDRLHRAAGGLCQHGGGHDLQCRSQGHHRRQDCHWRH